MKTKYLIGTIAGILFLVVAIYSFSLGAIEYADFASAMEKGKTVQVIGAWDKELPHNYDNTNNTFTFHLRDEKGGVAKVTYKGSKPNNFDIAPMVVVKGKFENNDFIAKEVLTKCPSKYDGKMESNADNK